MPKDLETLNPRNFLQGADVGTIRKMCGGNLWRMGYKDSSAQSARTQPWRRGTECQQNEGKWDEAS